MAWLRIHTSYSILKIAIIYNFIYYAVSLLILPKSKALSSKFSVWCEWQCSVSAQTFIKRTVFLVLNLNWTGYLYLMSIGKVHSWEQIAKAHQYGLVVFTLNKVRKSRSKDESFYYKSQWQRWSGTHKFSTWSNQ